MKIVKLVLMMMFPVLCLVAQESEKGTLETYDGKVITLYEFPPDDKVNFQLKKGCDCKLDKTKFKYYDKEGKKQKIQQKEVKFVNLKKGTNLCKTTVSQGAITAPMILEFDLAEPLLLFGLPTMKNGKLRVIHFPLASNDDYMLTSVPNGSSGAYLYLFKKGEDKYIQGGVDYKSVGYGSRGKKMLNNIKKYFKDCDKVMNQLRETEKHNSKVKRFKKLPLLDGVLNFEC